MQDPILEKIAKEQMKKRPDFRVGDKVSVSVRLKEGDKERVQIYRGVVILKHPKSGKGPGATFTVRKISEGVGVERVFPVHSPFIEAIKVDSSSEVRRSRLFYLRGLRGKKARLRDSETFADLVAPEKAPGPTEADVVAAVPEEAAAATAKAPENPKK